MTTFEDLGLTHGAGGEEVAVGGEEAAAGGEAAGADGEEAGADGQPLQWVLESNYKSQ